MGDMSDQETGGQSVLDLTSHVFVPWPFCTSRTPPQPCRSGMVWDVARASAQSLAVTLRSRVDTCLLNEGML